MVSDCDTDRNLVCVPVVKTETVADYLVFPTVQINSGELGGYKFKRVFRKGFEELVLRGVDTFHYETPNVSQPFKLTVDVEIKSHKSIEMICDFLGNPPKPAVVKKPYDGIVNHQMIIDKMPPAVEMSIRFQTVA